MTRSTDETRNRFDSMSVPGLSSRAQNAVNAALEAMSSWRSESAESSEKNMKRVIGKMAAAAAELGWPEQIVDTARTAAAEPHRNADQDDGSDGGGVGGAGQIDEFRLAVGHAEQAEVHIQLARWLAGRRCLPDGGDEPITVLDDVCRTVAKSLDRYDDNVDQGRYVIRPRGRAPALSAGAAIRA